MPRFLVLATGPLVDDPSARFVSGQCLRTLHFVLPMLRAGHAVDLALLPIEPGPGDRAPAARRKVSVAGWDKPLAVVEFHTQDPALILPRVRHLLDARPYDGVVGVNAWPAATLADAGPNAPFWADLNGWTMAEGAARAAVVGHDRDHEHFWRLEAEALLAADRFSTVSTRQADALYGELALLGRLGRKTFEWPFATAVPNAIYPLFDRLERSPSGKLPCRLNHADQAALFILWSGGFNAWTDVETLVGALDRVLASHGDAHFVATGGPVHGHDDQTFARFQEESKTRLPTRRVHLLGWVGTEVVAGWHARAHVGLNVDAPNAETRFGARNRLTNMVGAGLPVVTTAGSEIAAWISGHQPNNVVPPRDPDALARALSGVLANPAGAEAQAQVLREAARVAFRPEATLGAFLDWCACPAKAPDQAAGQSPLTPEALLADSSDPLTVSRAWALLRARGEAAGLVSDRAALRRLLSHPAIRAGRAMKRKLGR